MAASAASPYPPRDHERDSALIAAMRSGYGELEAFRQLYVELSGRLADYAYTLVGSGDMAEDIVQDVMARLWERRMELMIHGTVEAYLFQAVRFRARNVRRDQ